MSAPDPSSPSSSSSPPTIHPDFSLPWCQTLLTSPSTTITPEPHPETSNPDSMVSNSMFTLTLNTPRAIRAQQHFHRPSPSSTSTPTPTEYCTLLSIGDGVDGKRGRAHGGFNALILDQVLGMTASRESGHFAPATATMTVDYKAPIDTPGVVLCRGWATEKEGRKTWVRGVVEDGQGKVLAEGRALFVGARGSKA